MRVGDRVRVRTETAEMLSIPPGAGRCGQITHLDDVEIVIAADDGATVRVQPENVAPVRRWGAHPRFLDAAVEVLAEAAGRPIRVEAPRWSGGSMLARAIAYMLGEDGGEVPLRAPHHTISRQGMIGLGARPGELDSAAGGVLLLDQLREFRRDALEEVSLRLSDMTVVAVDLPCPCASTWHIPHCDCSPETLARWAARLPTWLEAPHALVLTPETCAVLR